MNVPVQRTRIATRMWLEGSSAEEIALAIRGNPSEVRRALRRRGFEVARVKSGRTRRSGLWDVIADLYMAGKSLAAIGRMVGMHHTSVNYAVGRMIEQRGLSRTLTPAAQKSKDEAVALEKATRRRVHKERNANIARMYQRNISCPEIAKRAKLHPSTVQRVLHAQGVPMRTADLRALQIEREAKQRKMEEKRAAQELNMLRERQKTLRIERMMEIVSRRKDWAA